MNQKNIKNEPKPESSTLRRRSLVCNQGRSEAGIGKIKQFSISQETVIPCSGSGVRDVFRYHYWNSIAYPPSTDLKQMQDEFKDIQPQI